MKNIGMNKMKKKHDQQNLCGISNVFIAEYIGVDVNFSPDVYKDSKSVLRHYIDNRSKSDGLLFDRDWNWLMAAVEEINKRDWVTIYNDECKIHALLSGEFETIDVVNEGYPLIKSVFEAVSKYAEWYLLNVYKK